jgi:hypothetical protein
LPDVHRSSSISAGAFRILSEPRAELGRNLRFIEGEFSDRGIPQKELFNALRLKVGPRYHSRRPDSPLPLLSLSEYEFDSLLELGERSCADPQIDWDEIAEELGGCGKLFFSAMPSPMTSLAEQASWWQRIYGPPMNEIPLELRKA